MLVFGYSLAALSRRVRYYIYLKCAKSLFRCGLFDKSFRRYISSVDLSFELGRQADNLYCALNKYQTDKSESDRVDSVKSVLKGQLEIFNYCLVAEKFDWNIDPITGFRWEKDVWYRDSRLHLPFGTDIKRPWELSRLYFILPVSLEYFSSKDEQLAKYVIDTVLHWSKSNPVGTAPNWSCTMEVGIRFANIVLSLVLLSRSKYFLANQVQLARLLNSHIGFIENNFENISTITSNHYVANISGLYVGLKFLPLTSCGQRAIQFARRELELEIAKQTLPDGHNFELSSSYHRLVFEFFYYAVRVSSPNEFSETYKEILKHQLHVLNTLVKPSGDIVQLGDNDSGRFLVLTGLQNLGSTWLPDDLAVFNKQLGCQHNSNEAHFHESAGVYIAKFGDFYFCVKGGRKGQCGLGGHSHNDTFSFELQYQGKDIAIDPGVGSYTADPALRNLFRSNSVHNGIYWKDIEESSLDKGLFCLYQESKSEQSAKLSGSVFEFHGRHEYSDRWHERTIKVDLERLTVDIFDEVSSGGAVLNITVPIAKVMQFGNRFQHAGCSFIWDDEVLVYPEAGLYSSKYGILEEAVHLRVPLPERKLITRIRVNQ